MATTKKSTKKAAAAGDKKTGADPVAKKSATKKAAAAAGTATPTMRSIAEEIVSGIDLKVLGKEGWNTQPQIDSLEVYMVVHNSSDPITLASNIFQYLDNNLHFTDFPGIDSDYRKNIQQVILKHFDFGTR